MNPFPKALAKLKSWMFLLLSLSGMTGLAATPLLFVSLTTPVLAQTQSERQEEAERLLDLCREYLEKEQFESALESCQQALSSYQEIKDSLGEASALLRLGAAYFFLEQFQQGSEFLQQALTIAQEIGETELATGIKQILLSSLRKIEADRLLEQGNRQLDISQYREALQSWQKALEIYQEIRDRIGEADSLNSLGLTYSNLGEYGKAIDFYQQSLAITQDIGDHEGEAISLNNLGFTYSNLGEYGKAIDLNQQSLAIFQDIGNRIGEADSLNNLGNAYLSLGEYGKAIDLNQQSLAITQDIGDRNMAAVSLGNLGNPYVLLGEYGKAIDFFQQSLAIFKDIGNRNGEADSLNNLGNAYLSLAEYSKAIDFYQQSLAIKQEIGDRNGEANSFGNVGSAYSNLGEYGKAIDFYQQSLAILQDIGDRNGEAGSIMGLGNAYSNLGEYSKAIDFYQQSLAISQEIGDRNGQASSLGNLGTAYYSLGEYGKAIDFHQKALAISQAIGDRNGQASSLNNLGNAYRNLGEYPKAIDFYQQSLAIFQDIGTREEQGRTLSNLGDLYKQQEQPELAIVFYKQSVIVRENIRQNIQVLERQLQESYTETVAGTYRSLADLLLSQDRIYEAQQVLELLKLQEIQDFTRSKRARGELPKVVLLPQEQTIIDIYGKLVTFGAEIAKCEQSNCSELSALEAQWEDLTRKYDQEIITLESFIRQRSFDDPEQFLKPNVFDQTANRIIQASDQYNSESGTVVIYPLVLKDKLWLLWATQGEVVSKREITNVGREQLNREVLKLRLFLQDPNSDIKELEKTAQQLYNWLIKPIEEELETGNINHLAFSLDRGLRYIPTAVLHDGEKYLIEKYTVTTFISAEFTDTEERLPEKIEETSVIGVGASEVRGYDPLPHVTTEIDFIVKEAQPDDLQGIYPGDQLLNEVFTFSNLKNNLAKRKVLHIATHGKFVPENQYESFLVLGDGNKLSIPDIKILRRNLKDVHLVVLSACETAVGDSFLTDPTQEEGIEINALSFYFLSGGAETVMASLWRVDDSSTSQLMQRFYCTLANETPSITKAQALRQAQLSLLNNTPLNCEQSTSDNSDFSHPYYWTPFILIGNGL